MRPTEDAIAAIEQGWFRDLPTQRATLAGKLTAAGYADEAIMAILKTWHMWTILTLESVVDHMRATSSAPPTITDTIH